MTGYVQVSTTTGTKEDAERIASVLVERRLAACVQIAGLIESTYWWEGKVETAGEWLCLAKTRGELYGAVEQAVREIHPYDTPEIIATPIVAGSPAYLKWLDDETRSDS